MIDEAVPGEFSDTARLEHLRGVATPILQRFLQEERPLTETEKGILAQITHDAPPEFPSLPHGRKVTTLPEKGLIDDYLDADFIEYSTSSEGYDSESPRDVESEEAEATELLKFVPQDSIGMELIPKGWELLDRFSEEWKEIYNLIKYSRVYRKLRDEDTMFQVVKAILYHEKEKCSWRSLSRDFIAGDKAYYYKCLWEEEGRLAHIIQIINRLPTPKATPSL